MKLVLLKSPENYYPELSELSSTTGVVLEGLRDQDRENARTREMSDFTVVSIGVGGGGGAPLHVLIKTPFLVNVASESGRQFNGRPCRFFGYFRVGITQGRRTAPFEYQIAQFHNSAIRRGFPARAVPFDPRRGG